MRWHLVTAEYPPASGGVGDYTAELARALTAAGDRVDVWVGGPGQATTSGSWPIHVLPDCFGRDSQRALASAWLTDPGIVLVQYVPAVFGRHGTNVPFCRWLLEQRRAGYDVRVMFHEPYFYFSWQRPWRNVLAIVQRVMARIVLQASTHVYYSSSNWDRYLRSYGAPVDARVLPIPATVPANPSWALVSEFRARFSAEGSPVVGHFGTFGDHVAGVLTPMLERLLREEQHVNIALIGTSSDAYRDAFVRLVPAAANRIHATGRLNSDAVAAAVRACDVMVQPYPDGVTTRRTSVMASLANETATVTTDGPLTEPAWRESDGVKLVPVFDPASAVRATIELLRDPAARAALARRGGNLYRSEFALDVTIAKLRAVGAVAR
jgi:glycosyltransferase involved in cell wall biosynthesis